MLETVELNFISPKFPNFIQVNLEGGGEKINISMHLPELGTFPLQSCSDNHSSSTFSTLIEIFLNFLALLSPQNEVNPALFYHLDNILPNGWIILRHFKSSEPLDRIKQLRTKTQVS